MKYKALMLDIDGTVSPNRSDGIPTPRVTDAIAKVSSKIHVSLVTGRPLYLAKPIMDHLKLSGPCIITDGSQIYDPVQRRFIHETPMSDKAANEVQRILKRYPVKVYVNDGRAEFEKKEGHKIKRTFGIFVPSIPKETADLLVQKLNHVPTITAYKGVDWTPGMEYLAVSDINATKLHGVKKVSDLLGIDTKEMIGVGDGYNDFPLLMACGLKIAMGNAVPELKAIADFIAPSVDEDGVATVIEKFILHE